MIMEYYVGQIILHEGRYKTVRVVGNGWIETLYLRPNDKGWRKVEKIYMKQLQPFLLKIEDYKHINLDKLEGLIEGMAL